jgi:hypothetical protein
MIIPISFYVIIRIVKHQLEGDKIELESSSLIVIYENNQPYLYLQAKDNEKAIEILKNSNVSNLASTCGV